MTSLAKSSNLTNAKAYNSLGLKQSHLRQLASAGLNALQLTIISRHADCHFLFIIFEISRPQKHT